MTDEQPRTRRVLRRAAVVVCVTLLTGALLEGGLRVAGYGDRDAAPIRFATVERQRAETEEDGPIVPDPLRFWRLRPGWRGPGYGIGSHGFRNPEVSVAKPQDTRRIACLGDSSVFGLGVAEAQIWPRATETLLSGRGTGGPVQVVNFGVPGYTSWQGRLLLEEVLTQWTPDVVVLGFGAFNDWIPAVDAPDSELLRPNSGLRLAQLVRAAAAAVRESPTTVAEAQDVSTLDTSSYTGPRRVSPAAFEDDLRAMCARVRAAGARVVLLSLPLPSDTVRRNPIALEYAERARVVATSEGVTRIDGWAVFRAAGRAEAELFDDFCHPSAAGHGLLAAEAARVLGE